MTGSSSSRADSPATQLDSSTPDTTSRTDSPVSPPAGRMPPSERLAPTLVALVVGGALAALAVVNATGLLVGVALIQAALVVSWVYGTALPGRTGALVLGTLTAAAADVVVVRWPAGQLGTLLAVAGLAVPAMFVHQLLRGVVRTRVVESLSDIAVLLISVLALPAVLQLRHEPGGPTMASGVLLAVTVALVVAGLVDLVAPVPRFDPAVPRGLLAVLAGTASGACAGLLRLHGTVEFTSGRAALVGGAVGLAATLFAIGSAFVDEATTAPSGPAARLRAVSGVVLPIALSAPVGYLLCLAIRG